MRASSLPTAFAFGNRGTWPIRRAASSTPRPAAQSSRLMKLSVPDAHDVDRVSVVLLEELDQQLVDGRFQIGEAGDINPLGLQARQDCRVPLVVVMMRVLPSQTSRV